MYLTRKRIDAGSFLPESVDHGPGACVLFFGRVRDHSEGKKVLFLEYEAYEEMAERMMGRLVVDSLNEWQLTAVKLLHRLGQIAPGELAVAIAVESLHREEAYRASRYLIEGVKHLVPIWKKEHFEGGTSVWSVCAMEAKSC
jgi:molybdopterin synthase catalytic subunit